VGKLSPVSEVRERRALGRCHLSQDLKDGEKLAICRAGEKLSHSESGLCKGPGTGKNPMGFPHSVLCVCFIGLSCPAGFPHSPLLA
jgi:hypothetical protein